jgi:hypothetical protein
MDKGSASRLFRCKDTNSQPRLEQNERYLLTVRMLLKAANRRMQDLYAYETLSVIMKSREDTLSWIG